MKKNSCLKKKNENDNQNIAQKYKNYLEKFKTEGLK